MTRLVFCAVVAATLLGCSVESQSDFDDRPFDAVADVNRPYQAVYADIVRGARKCWGSGPMVTAMPQSVQLDAQLYPDLGYGEVFSYAAGTVFLPQAMVRVERVGAGTKVSVKVGPVAAARPLFLEPALQWSSGNVACGRLS